MNRITKEFMLAYLSKGKVYGSGRYLSVHCQIAWPWGKHLFMQYIFDTESHSLKRCHSYNQSTGRYISRDSDEYKGFILFITQRELTE